MYACQRQNPSERPKMVNVVEQLLEWLNKRQAKQGRSAPLRSLPPAPAGSLTTAGENGEGAPSASVDNGSLPTPFRDRANSAKAAL